MDTFKMIRIAAICALAISIQALCLRHTDGTHGQAMAMIPIPVFVS